MERQLIAALLAAIILSLQIAAYTEPTLKADRVFAQKQKDLYNLFWHVDQPTIDYPELYDVAKSWNIPNHINDYTDKEVVNKFLELWKNGMLPRGKLFSYYYSHLKTEMIALFDLFYFAKDYETFYKTAVWARFNMNEQMYQYCLYLAILHRPDTKHIRLPYLYELLPHYFFNEDVIFQAQRIQIGDVENDNKNSYLIRANYTGWYITHDHDMEWKLNYFTEDIGMNSFYFYINAIFPPWMKSDKYKLMKEVRGESYYFLHKQIIARYYMERLSHDLGQVEYIDWDRPIVTGYYPSMIHPTGLPFPQRPSWSDIPVHKYKFVERINNIESRISIAIDSGKVMTHDNHYELYKSYMQDMNYLGNMIQGNMDSPFLRYYDSLDRLSRNILGYGHETSSKYQPIISALDMTVTSMRDPGFYRMYKKIVDCFLKYKSNLPLYTREELGFPGVKIESVAVDKLVTYFDVFESIISNGVAVRNEKEAKSLLIKARQQRLNHKPYNYHITVNSNKATKGWIRIFLGPKYDVHGHEIDMMDNWMNFFEMDKWVVDLNPGTNEIKRSSHESFYIIPDEMPSIDFYNMVQSTIDKAEGYKFSSQMHGFPDRMMLPKGKPEGMIFKLFVYISPYNENMSVDIDIPVYGTKHFEFKPMGFPLDRPLYYYDKTMPNMYWKDVPIFHKNV